MSAFILPPEQFAEINTGLQRAKIENGYNKTRATLDRLLMTREHNTKNLVKEWARLNVEAVRQRYGEDTASWADSESINFTKGAKNQRMTPPSLLKHLHCLRYQMSEGNVPETDGYKDLDSLIRTLADDIAENTLDYVMTPWGNAIKD